MSYFMEVFMKFLKFVYPILAATWLATPCWAQMQNLPINSLPPPNIFGGLAIMEALNNRHSGKDFSYNTIDYQTLSEILWAAWGINRDDGKRTVPTAMNQQNMQVYVLMANGAWLYNAQNNNIEQVTAQDLRSYLQTQEYTQNAPVFLLYTTNGNPAGMTDAMQAGSMYQNVALYCAAKGLNNVVRADFQKSDLAAALGIDEDTILISQVVGYPI